MRRCMAYNVAVDFAMAFVSDEEPDTIVVADLVLHDLRSTVLQDHDAVAFVLRNLVLRDLRHRRDAHDPIVLSIE